MVETGSLPLHFLHRPPERPPAPGRRPPLLLLLHGIGANEADLFGLAARLDPRFHILSLRAPLTFAPGSHGWFEVRFTAEGSVIRLDQAVSSWQRLIAFVEQAPGAIGTDPDSVYLLGFSQGAIMSIALALTRPELLAGIVALSGRTLPELFDRTTPFGPFLAEPEALAGFPLFIGHGLRDDVLPIHHARATRDRFAALPVKVTYREYEMGHFISEACLADAAGWLSERLDGAARNND